MMLPPWLFSLLILGLLLLVGIFITRFFPPGRPASVGLRSGSLQPCGSKPNCVCSLQPGTSHGIESFPILEGDSNPLEKIASIVAAMPGARIITSDNSYLYAEFKTTIFGFIDDVEFHLDGTARRIEVRSASRLGYSDLGVNRSRVESIRARYPGK